MIEGLDVAHWQATTPPLAGKAFGFAKASEGTTSDAKYSMHMKNFRTAGLVAMSYCFARDDVQIAAQANFYVNASGPLAEALCIDNEGGHSLTKAQTTQLLAAIKAADALHRPVGLYMSASVFFDAGQDFDWIADYRAAISHTRPGTFWQYADGPGYDHDKFNGSVADLHKLVGRPGRKLREDALNLVPGTVYHTAIVPKPGSPVFNRPGGTRIYITKVGDRFPEVGDDLKTGHGDYHVMRMPGDIAGYIGHGLTNGTVPL